MIAVNTGLGKTEPVGVWVGGVLTAAKPSLCGGREVGKRGWCCQNCKPEPPRPDPNKGRPQHLPSTWIIGPGSTPPMCFHLS